MTVSNEIIRTTRSVCPVCLKPLKASLILRNGIVYQDKHCPEHGDFSVPVWHNKIAMDLWRKGVDELKADEGLSCPGNCGICSEHQSGTCCALMEVTKRCNLNCRFCFAHGGETDEQPPLSELMETVRNIMTSGKKPLLQLSGGEPTLRDDLPALIAWAKACGAPYVQLNSNGIRLANDEAYVRDLAGAGLSFVFMQFDGVDDDVYMTLRGKPLLDTKIKAIEMCGKYNLGVSLVPTVVRGVNDNQLGKIVSFAAAHSPVVRGVHFQPVSYFGRNPGNSENRYTMDELIAGLGEQIGLPAGCIVPSHCDHPMCGFHGSFIVSEDKSLMPLSSFAGDIVKKTSAEANREYVAKHWISAAENEEGCCGKNAAASSDSVIDKEEPCCCCCGDDAVVDEVKTVVKKNDDAIELDDFLRLVKERSLTLSSMAFMDSYNFDIERLRHCSLHVWKDGKLMPFCSAYLTPAGC